MMRALFLAWSLCTVCLAPAWAQIRKFPYEGIIETDSAYLRSGPGRQYYPTTQLERGTRITVHRHDPGGWYMVAPLSNSFSWVRAEYVEKTGNDRGLIRENNVVVRVGSTFGDDTREVEQVRLSKNDQVRILDEKTLTTSNGPVKHYKIAPPTGEYRWVSGKYVTPVDQIVRKQHDTNPFDVPAEVKKAQNPPADIAANKSPATLGNPFENPPQQSVVQNDAIRRNGPDPSVLAAQKQQLELLDEQFREMVNGRTQNWSFQSLEQGYQQLRQAAVVPALASQIDLRFAAIGRYRNIKKEYDDLVQLTTQTRQRDAQLLSIQKQQLPESAPVPPQLPDAPIQPIPDPFAQTDGRVPEPVDLPGVEPLQPNPQPQPSPQPTPQPSGQPPRFDGAGIVQRAAGAGGPAYVLVTPQGRVLAYLQPVPGLNLQPYVGRAMGIYGQRDYRQDLRMDYIVVRSLTPVRLAP